MRQKIEKNFFLSEIIACQLVSLICPYEEKIVFIGGQCVNKQSQHLACQ